MKDSFVPFGTLRLVVREWAARPELPPVNGYMVMPDSGVFKEVEGGDTIEVVLLDNGIAEWRVVRKGGLKKDHPNRVGASDGYDHSGRDFNSLYISGIIVNACFDLKETKE